MSEFHVRVVEVGKIQKHDNADVLSIADIEGYPVIFNHEKEPWKTGDLACYIPIDSIVPDTEQWAFLEGHRRIRARKLRGVFSMGMLAPLPDKDKIYHVGDNLQKELGITKWEPNDDGHSKREVILDEATIAWNKLPIYKKIFKKRFYKRLFWKLFEELFVEGEITCDSFPIYTDVEGLRKFSNILQDDEEVVIREKIHGQNGRFGIVNKKLYVGSHYNFKQKPRWKRDKVNNWWQIADAYTFDCLLPNNYGFYGEVYGAVQKGFPYDATPGNLRVRFFDVIDIKTRRYLDDDKFETICKAYNLPMAPVLYRGPWNKDLRSLAEGQSTLNDKHIREGFVVKPIKERYDSRIGRVVFKMVGEGYLLSKNS